MAHCITTLEQYGDLDVIVLRETKISETLKAIISSTPVFPCNGEWGFARRIPKLHVKFDRILGKLTTAPVPTIMTKGTPTATVAESAATDHVKPVKLRLSKAALQQIAEGENITIVNPGGISRDGKLSCSEPCSTIFALRRS